jgi:hypothetical protein
VIPNPKYEHVPVDNQYAEDEKNEILSESEKEPDAEEDGQLKIPFDFED